MVDPGRPTLPDPSAGDPLLPGCGHADPDHLCLGLRFVAYADEQGRPAVSAAQARRTIDGVNRVWRSCGLSFRLEDFRVEDPARLGLSYAPREHRELPRIRRALGEVERLLVVITGPWQRAGTLGRTTANAWTAMPGSGPYGAILERGVGANANLIAHELGHYLNLLHLTDELSLMNPIIYGRSVGLPREQCDAARSAARQFWAKMLR